MAKGEKDVPEWKKRVPYEQSEAAYHKKHHEPAEKVASTAAKEGKKQIEEVKGRIESVKERIEAAAGAERAKPAGEAVSTRAPATGETATKSGFPPAMEEVMHGSERVCDACGRIHPGACEIIQFAGQNFNVCGGCIPPVKENPADFLAGKKGTDPESKDFEVCGPKR